MALRRVIRTKSRGSGLVSYKVGPSKLYLDDLQMIHDTLLAAGEKRAINSHSPEPVKVEIKAGDALADEIDDLRDARPGELVKVRISLEDPSVTLDIWRGIADVSGNSRDPESQELAIGIRDYINDRRSLLSGLGPMLPMYCTLPPVTLLAGAALIYQNRAHPALSVIVVVAVTVLLLAFIYAANRVTVRRFGYVRVIPRKENEARGLKAETRKTLIIAVVSSLIIGLAGFWAGVFVNH